MKNMKHRLVGFIAGLALLAGPAMAADWYEATGKPAARSALSSADLRTEFAAIESDIADQLPVLTGNGDKVVVVNAGGTALTVAETGIAVTAGGTGSTTASGARTSLGLAIGSDVQDWDTDLDDIAALADTDGNIMVGNGSAWVAESGATARTSLGLAIGSNVQAYDATYVVDADIGSNVQAYDATYVVDADIGSTVQAYDATYVVDADIGSTVQAYDAELDEIAALANTDGNIIVGNGSVWVVESGATARTSLGVGTGDSPQFTSPYASTSIELGHATDTTLTRSAAGVLAVEGNDVPHETTGSFSVTFGDGCNGTGPSATMYYTKQGNIVHLYLVAALVCGTSDGANFQTTAADVPTALRPNTAARIVGFGVGYDNDGSPESVCITITTAGKIQIGRITNGKDCSMDWTTSGAKAANIARITYMIDII